MALDNAPPKIVVATGMVFHPWLGQAAPWLDVAVDPTLRGFVPVDVESPVSREKV